MEAIITMVTELGKQQATNSPIPKAARQSPFEFFLQHIFSSPRCNALNTVYTARRKTVPINNGC